MKKLFVFLVLTVATTVCVADELAIGAKAPQFALVNAADGRTVAFHPGDGKLSVVVFTCNQCPYAKAFEPRIVELARQYQPKGVAFYAVDPNDEAQYAVESLAEQVTGLPPVQVPDWQVSVCVQALPSLHAVPFALAGFEQAPVDGSQVPAL